jgi:hypothetical protein
MNVGARDVDFADAFVPYICKYTIFIGDGLEKNVFIRYKNGRKM